MAADCPFCQPGGDDRVALATSKAIALSDARSIMAGHLLVVSRKHLPSAFDLSAADLAGLRLLQMELTSRLYNYFGEVAAYEHGRSDLCRFHGPDRGHAHAHVHLLPVSVDLISRIPPHNHPQQSSFANLEPSQRYLYQKIGVSGDEVWVNWTGNVPRHFIRTKLEQALQEQDVPYLRVDQDPEDHLEVADETVSLIRSSTTPRPALLFLPFNTPTPSGLLESGLERDLKIKIVDADLLLRLGAALSLRTQPEAPLSSFKKIIMDLASNIDSLDLTAQTSIWQNLDTEIATAAATELARKLARDVQIQTLLAELALQMNHSIKIIFVGRNFLSGSAISLLEGGQANHFSACGWHEVPLGADLPPAELMPLILELISLRLQP